MKIGTKKYGIIQPYKQNTLVALDLTNIPIPHYRNVIPKQYRKNEPLRD